MRGPYFRGHERVAALDAGSVQALAHFAFVIVHLGRVYVPVAEAQRLFDNVDAATPTQLPGAKPEERDLGAIPSDARNGSGCPHSLCVYVSHFGACGGLTIRESGRASLAISAISASLSLKSRLP